MTPLILLGIAFALLTALALWADHTGWDPFARLYGSDFTAPADVQAWRKENWGGDSDA